MKIDPRAMGLTHGGFEWRDLRPGDLLFWPKGLQPGYRVVVRKEITELTHVRIWVMDPTVSKVWELDVGWFDPDEYILLWKTEDDEACGA